MTLRYFIGLFRIKHTQESAQWLPDPFPREREGVGRESGVWGLGSRHETTGAKAVHNRDVAAFLYVAITAIVRLRFTCLERVYWTV